MLMKNLGAGLLGAALWCVLSNGTAIAQDSGVTVSSESVKSTVSDTCCGKPTVSSRRRCLNLMTKRLVQVRGILGRDFVAAVNAYSKELKSNNCNLGPAPAPTPKAGSCNVRRQLSDGYGNWLYKPRSDSNGAVVILLPSGEDASSCRFQTKKGKKLFDLRYDGDTNPDRPTWRPVAGGFCSSMPDNSVLRCKVGRKNHCWTIPDPCNRYD